MRGTALLQRAYICRMRHRDIMTVAQAVLPTIDNIRACMEIFGPSSNLHPVLRYRALIDSLSKITAIFQNIENSPRWSETKQLWPEGMEGPVPTSGNVRMNE